MWRDNEESESEVAQLCLTICNPMDCSLPVSSIHGIFQARVLKWVAISFPGASSWPRDCPRVSCIVSRCFPVWVTWEDGNIEDTSIFYSQSDYLFYSFLILPSVQLLSHIRLFATPWTAAHQASLSITNSRSLLILMSIESVMPSNFSKDCIATRTFSIMLKKVKQTEHLTLYLILVNKDSIFLIIKFDVSDRFSVELINLFIYYAKPFLNCDKFPCSLLCSVWK